MENCRVWGAREKNKGKLSCEIASFCIHHSWHVLRRGVEMKVRMHCRMEWAQLICPPLSLFWCTPGQLRCWLRPMDVFLRLIVGLYPACWSLCGILSLAQSTYRLQTCGLSGQQGLYPLADVDWQWAGCPLHVVVTICALIKLQQVVRVGILASRDISSLQGDVNAQGRVSAEQWMVYGPSIYPPYAINRIC